MIKRILLFSFLILSFSNVGAQMIQNSSDNGMVIFTKEKEPDTYTGSPYVEKDFVSGVLHDDKGRNLSAFMRYNAIEDVVVVKTDILDTEEYMLPKLTSITYELKDYTYFIDNLKTDNGNIEAYFARYYQGSKSDFIARPEIDVVQAQKATTGYDKDKPAHIDVDMKYFISINDGVYKEVRLKEKDMKKLFSKSDGMDKYFSSNKIKDEKDVVKMLKFYENNAS